MALRLACDLDGTLADMDTALQREAERLFGPDVQVRARRPASAAVEGAVHVSVSADGVVSADAPADDDVPLDPPEGGASADEPILKTPLTPRQMRQLWAHVRRIENFWVTLQEIEPGAVAQLATRAAAHRWEVIFLTQRPSTAGATAQVQTQRWLREHGFELPSVFVMSGSRGLVANALALDAVIDDRPENCLDVIADSKARSILLWRGPAAVPPGVAHVGVAVVSSFARALGEIDELAAGDKRKGLVGRVRSALGI